MRVNLDNITQRPEVPKCLFESNILTGPINTTQCLIKPVATKESFDA